jgi:uncharacterized spore protein YtfJ
MSQETRNAERGTSQASVRSAGSTEEPSALIRGIMGELETMLDAKHVVSEPITLEGTTIVPLVSVGFGFGAGSGGGGGRDKDGDTGEGGGGGGGGGGGVKPVAVLVIQDGNVRLEPIPEPASGLGRLGNAIADTLDRRSQKTDDD